VIADPFEPMARLPSSRNDDRHDSSRRSEAGVFPVQEAITGETSMSPPTRAMPSADRDSARDSTTYQFVGFRLDGEDYAIAITKIQEIIVMKPITRIPQMPAFIEGLINLRGSVIPIINLRTLFGLPVRELDDETRTIIVNVGDRTIGYIVDEVTQVMRIAGEQIQPAPVTITAVSKQHIAGLARLEDRLLIILEIDRLLKPEELVVTIS
jgi:purine-binding chemotaxis protein CheW